MLRFRPSIGDAIMKRAAASRAEMRTLLAKMNEKQIECLGKQMFELITDAVENADKSDKVWGKATRNQNCCGTGIFARDQS